MFTLQKIFEDKCTIGGHEPKGGIKTVVVRDRGTNSYKNQGFDIDNNLNKYRKYLAFFDCKNIKIK